MKAVPNQRNQNPNLFRNPQSHRFFLTYYRGNDKDQFEIVSRNAASIEDLDNASEKAYRDYCGTHPHVCETCKECKPPRGGSLPSGHGGLSTPLHHGPRGRMAGDSDSADGSFCPVTGNPILHGERACLFQHTFHDRFYAYDCHLQSSDHWVLEEVEAPLQK